MDTAFDKEFEFAKSTLLEASTIAVSYFEKNPKSRLKADDTIVTEADEKVEEFIREKVLHEFPSYGFIGEETAEEKKDISWVVDPIDGTTAFSRGIPNFASVIGLEAEGNVIFSFIYLPITKTLYSARLNRGSFRNGNPIRVSLVDTIDSAQISFDRRAAQREYSREYIEKLIKKYHVRMGDHAGLATGYLAQGSIEVLIKFNQKIWDTAPEMLLIQEAGGIVTDEFGDPLKLIFSKDASVHYIATNPALHEKYKDILYFPK